MMNRPIYLLWLIMLLSLPVLAQSSRPNIVFIVADDLGYGDLSAFGNRAVETPHLDALARAGIRLTNFHTASGVCSPSRASFLTGRYPLQLGITKHFDDGEEHLPRGITTLPQLLNRAGYQTAHIGKWHLGGLNKKHLADRAHSIPGPLQHGFKHYLAGNEEAEPRARLGRERQLYRQGAKYLFRDDQPEPPQHEHLTEVETAAAETMLEQFQRQSQPFYLQLWFLNPHAPYEPAPDKYLKPHEGKATGDELLYRSMLSQLDGSVGRIVAKLKQLGLADNTLIIFTSDNGPTGPGSPGEFRGGKGTLFEGGLRVPFIAVWPGKIKPQSVSQEFAHGTDLLPTLCAAAGINAPPRSALDGINLLNHWRNGKSLPARGTIFWQMNGYANFQRERKEPTPYATEAARNGKWKLLAREGQALALYDLAADPYEKNNSLHAQPRIAERLNRELKSWLAKPRLSSLEKP